MANTNLPAIDSASRRKSWRCWPRTACATLSAGRPDGLTQYAFRFERSHAGMATTPFRRGSVSDSEPQPEGVGAQFTYGALLAGWGRVRLRCWSNVAGISVLRCLRPA